MGKFKSEDKKSVPGFNASSMSDIIFMFLFFFMVISTMRESTLFVKITVPQGSEIQKLEKKSLSSNIFVGVPIEEKKFGSAPRIQLNDQFAEISDIKAFIEAERAGDFKAIIFVTAPEKERIARIIKRDQCTEEQARNMIRAQLADEAKLALAARSGAIPVEIIMIENHGDQSELEKKVVKTLDRLR